MAADRDRKRRAAPLPALACPAVAPTARSHPPGAVESPGLSVVVPAYREREVIAAKVEDVRRNGYPGELEVLVVTEDPPTAEAARGRTHEC